MGRNLNERLVATGNPRHNHDLGGEQMNMVLFQYRKDTPVETILSHHRVARWIIYPCGFSCLTVLSSLARGLVFRFDTVTIGILIVSLCGAALLVIPALLCIPWLRDAEAELSRRSIPIPGGVGIEKRIVRTTGKMMLWAIAIVVAAMLVSELVERIAQHGTGG